MKWNTWKVIHSSTDSKSNRLETAFSIWDWLSKVYAALKKIEKASDIVVVASFQTQVNLPVRATKKAEKSSKNKDTETSKK